MKNTHKCALLISAVRAAETEIAIGKLLSQGIRCLLVKGISHSRFYPSHIVRESYDVDIAVHPEDFELAKRLEDEGAFAPLLIDLHRGLGNLDRERFDEVFENAESMSIGNRSVMVPKLEDCLRIAIRHWVADGGRHRHRLDDIAYMISAAKASFDFDYFLKKGESLEFFAIPILCAHRYSQVEFDIPEWIPAGLELPISLTGKLEDVWNSTLSYKSLASSKRSLRELGRQVRLRSRLFPIMSLAPDNCDGRFTGSNYTLFGFAQSRGLVAGAGFLKELRNRLGI
ncbi:MAG: hypothetical protein R2684_07465 [Pyrinomonadaceae bacterium]